MHAISPRIIGRVAALFFLAAALGSLVPGPAWSSYAAQMGLLLGNVLVGLAAWFIPWERWRRSATLWLAPVALADMAAAVLTRGYNPATFAMYYLVLFVWAGVSFRRGTSVRLAPLAAAAYFVPMYAVEGSAAAMAVLEVVPVAVIVGEGVAWVSARLRSAEQLDDARVAEMRQLLSSAELLARQTDPRQAAGLIAELGARLLRSDGTAVILVEDEGGWIPGATLKWPESPETGRPLLGPHAPPEWQERDPEGVALLPPVPLERQVGAPLPFSSVMVLELRGLTRARGVLIAGLRDERRRFDSFDKQLALAFARQAGFLLDRVEALESLRNDSLRDELTGLGNRRQANAVLAGLKSGDALVAIDLDHFKELNDTRGHAVGDEVLRRFATQVKIVLRDSDSACRLGGDEFLLVLRQAGEHAPAVIERLRRQWSQVETFVGFSAGIAQHHAGDAGEATLQRADEALYRVKRAGRGASALAVEPGAPSVAAG